MRTVFFLALFSLPAIAAGELRLIEGDTVALGSERVRFVGRAAPEIRGACREERRLAQCAASVLEGILAAEEPAPARRGITQTLVFYYADAGA